MRFATQPNLPRKISTVCLELNDILLSGEFHSELQAFKKNFDQSNIDGPSLSEEILRIMRHPERTVKVRKFSFPWYQFMFRKTVVANVKDEFSINLNSYFLEVNDDVEYANTIGHELVHIVDNLSPYWFGHGSDDPTGDELTAPHIVGDICARLYYKRRYKKLRMAARAGEPEFNQEMTAIGAENKEKILNSIGRGVFVHDYGTEFRTSSEDPGHTAD